jgi:hypothetical protein
MPSQHQSLPSLTLSLTNNNCLIPSRLTTNVIFITKSFDNKFNNNHILNTNIHDFNVERSIISSHKHVHSSTAGANMRSSEYCPLALPILTTTSSFSPSHLVALTCLLSNNQIYLYPTSYSSSHSSKCLVH